MKRHLKLAGLVLLGVLGGLWIRSDSGAIRMEPTSALPFALLPGGQVATWEAEQAQPQGAWQRVDSARASAGAYMVPRTVRETSTLRFAFDSDQPANLQVWPVLGPHSDRRPARRFPYPLERRPGPDTIVAASDGSGQRLFFTSPELGRVTAFDGEAEKILQSASLGGYLADLVLDQTAQRLYAADAVGHRIAVLAAGDLALVREISVPGDPWSLALHQGTLYVGCLRAKKVVALDPATGSILAQADLPYQVAHVEVRGEANPQVVARPLPWVLDLETQTSIPAEREQYGFARRLTAESGERSKPGWKRIRWESPQSLRIETLTDQGWTAKVLEAQPVTGAGPGRAGLGYPPIGPDGPDYERQAMVAAAGRLFFTAPATGQVGVVDLEKDQLLAPLKVGGRPSDVVYEPSTRTVMVADAAGHRVVQIDPKTLEVKGKGEVPAVPVALESFSAPGWLKGCQPWLLVACWGRKQVVALDPATLKVAWQADLPAEPILLKVETPPDTSWWPNIPTDQLPVRMRTRLGVFLAPRAFQPRTLAEIGPVEASPDPSRQREVAFDLPAGRKKVFTVDNRHTLGIAVKEAQGSVLEQRWVDTTEFTDPQQSPLMAPLTPKDEPGALTLSLDGGPWFPWRRELWMTPDEEQFLRADTEEFWRWNAPVFSLGPGRHVLEVQAHSPFVQIDALRVVRTLQGRATLQVTGQPPQAESLPERYRSLFYGREPVRFKLTVGNHWPEPLPFRLDYEVQNYLQETVASGRREWTVPGRGWRSEVLPLPLRDTGTFTLNATLSSPHGQMKRTYRFLRVPKLEHPRLLFRKEEIPAIRARIQQNAPLFRRYFEWLRRQCDRQGFLPAGILKSTFLPQLPEEQKRLSQQGGWRRYELGWRLLAVQFGAMFAEEAPLREYFRSRIAQVLRDGRADRYCTFHYHGPFFPGLEAVLFDLVAGTPGEADEEVQRLREFFAQSLGDMDVFPWTLAALEEPLTPKERAILWHIGSWLFNVERYFNTHMGTRGGQRWLNDRTGCFCPYAGYGYSFIYLSHLLDEPQFHETKKFVTGFLTHTELVHPHYDNRGMLGPVGPRGEPLKWLDSILCQHPLEKGKYTWEGLLKQLQRPDLSPEEVDRLLEYPECASTSQPMAFVVPLGLALGWYHPEAPAVRFEDLPPTVLFDGEGDVMMRSGWKPQDTQVYFTCGIRDHVYRHQPSHLQIAKGGEFLLGTASSWSDDGNSDPGKTWGNVVVIEPSDWLRQWGENKRHPRAEEYCVFNRFSDETFRYLSRDQRLSGYAPAEAGFGGGLDLHGHTESLFVQEGQLLAYETQPHFDYVAGDATNAWPLGLAQEVYRQVVFVKPDTVVVYDRVELGPRAERAFWLAATGSQLEVNGNHFLVRSGKSALGGQVLLPQAVTAQTFDPSQSNRYTTPPPFSVTQSWYLFDGLTRHQKVLELWPAQPGRKLEFLVVLQAAMVPEAKAPLALPRGDVARLLDESYAGARFQQGDQLVQVRFRRSGEVGGDLTFTTAGERTTHTFVSGVEDHYRHWSKDPRYPRWIHDPALAFFKAK